MQITHRKTVFHYIKKYINLQQMLLQSFVKCFQNIKVCHLTIHCFLFAMTSKFVWSNNAVLPPSHCIVFSTPLTTHHDRKNSGYIKSDNVCHGFCSAVRKLNLWVVWPCLFNNFISCLCCKTKANEVHNIIKLQSQYINYV